MTEVKVMDGHVFTPSLQDISLKRFRLRYCPLTDGYFLHWDNKVGQHLTRIQGLENGVHNMFGIQRVVTPEGDMSYLSMEGNERATDTKKQSTTINNGSEKTDHQLTGHQFPPSISWKLDFGGSGLAIKNIQIKASVKQYTEQSGMSLPDDGDDDNNEEDVTFKIAGDEESMVDRQVYLGDYYTEIPILKGSKSVTLTAQLHPSSTNNDRSMLFLPSSSQKFDTPLDIVINLMCLKREEWPFVGEILLGLKYSQSGASESLKEKPNITVDCGVMGGQLQVHVVEGAGLVKEGTKKPFNSFVKCRLLPDQNNAASKHTSPKHNSYPTWTKEFIFAGIDKYDLQHGGIELMLYDHHKIFSDTLIGGVRLSHPQTVSRDPIHRFSTGGTLPISQPLSRDCSPVHNSPATPGPSTQTVFLDIINSQAHLSASQPDLLSIGLDNNKLSQTSFGTLNRPTNLSPTGSPLLRRVPVFTPRTRDSPTSPFGSPKFMRKNQKAPKLSLTLPITAPLDRVTSDELMYWWMDSTRNEVTHWKKILNNPGQWIYCWHIIRPRITPA